MCIPSRGQHPATWLLSQGDTLHGSPTWPPLAKAPQPASLGFRRGHTSPLAFMGGVAGPLGESSMASLTSGAWPLRRMQEWFSARPSPLHCFVTNLGARGEDTRGDVGWMGCGDGGVHIMRMEERRTMGHREGRLRDPGAKESGSW